MHLIVTVCAGERPTFAATLHSELLSLSERPGELQGFLLSLLCAILKCQSMHSHKRRLWLLPAYQHLVQAVIAAELEHSRTLLQHLASAGVQVCCELSRLYASCRQPLRVLRCIARSQPLAVLAHTATLASLAPGILLVPHFPHAMACLSQEQRV